MIVISYYLRRCLPLAIIYDSSVWHQLLFTMAVLATSYCLRRQCLPLAIIYDGSYCLLQHCLSLAIVYYSIVCHQLLFISAVIVTSYYLLQQCLSLAIFYVGSVCNQLLFMTAVFATSYHFSQQCLFLGCIDYISVFFTLAIVYYSSSFAFFLTKENRILSIFLSGIAIVQDYDIGFISLLLITEVFVTSYYLFRQCLSLGFIYCSNVCH